MALWQTNLEGRGASPTAALAALVALPFSDLLDNVTLQKERKWDPVTGQPMPNPEWIARGLAMGDGTFTKTP